MRIIFTLVTLFTFAIVTHAQDTSKPKDVVMNNEGSYQEFQVVQIQAQFPGGPPAWIKYLQQNLRAEVAAENIVLRRRQKDSLQQVIVSFLVDTEGNISETKVENPESVHPKVGAEAMRVIKNGPRWTPAVQDGKKVIYRQKQSITFAVSKG